jgi:hypothetical protein
MITEQATMLLTNKTLGRGLSEVSLLEIVQAFKIKKSLIHFCFKASFKAEKHLIQPGQKDPQI